jgi:hypothetical protein
MIAITISCLVGAVLGFIAARMAWDAVDGDSGPKAGA